MTTLDTELIEYVVNFKRISNEKPCNEEIFIDTFIEWISAKDLDFRFDGDGAYFGKQITCARTLRWGYDELTFEIAYDADQIVVYDGNNNGYWTPSYISLTSTDAKFAQLQAVIYDFIRESVGIN